MIVLPFVALCDEKANYLTQLLLPLNRIVRRFYANEGGGGPIITPETGGRVDWCVSTANGRKTAEPPDVHASKQLRGGQQQLRRPCLLLLLLHPCPTFKSGAV